MIRNNDVVQENLGGYRITANHSASVFSKTFVGESISPTAVYQHVLIKILSTAGVQTRQEREDILQKISFLQQLRHPHILPILSVGTHEDVPYIITEYLNAESLQDRVQSRTGGQPMEMQEALLILAQVGQALQYAHQQQVVHGYLSPQDVLFTMQNKVLVTGFHRHILHLPDEAEDTSPLELSIYRAPELSKGKAGDKSDQYALGCIAYDLFTGYRAFMIPSVNTPGTYYKTRSLIAPGKLNPALPSYIDEAILKAMSREPDQRYRDIAAFLAALKVSPATGTRDLKKTTVLPLVMLEEAAGISFTPPPESIKKRVLHDMVVAKDEKRVNVNVLSQLSPVPDMVEQVEPAISSDAVLLDVSSGYMSREDEITFKIHLPYGVTARTALSNIGKRPRSSSQRALIIIMCLIACIILFTTIMIALNFSSSANKPGTSPYVNGTSIVHSSTSTPVPVHVTGQPGSSSSTSGTNVPSQGQATNPSQGQGNVPNPALTPIPTRGSSGFLQGVSSVSASQAEFWFAPNGWTSSYMILHYTGGGQVQQNLYMSYNSSAGQWQYTVNGLSPAEIIIYWFTYQQNGMQYNSGTYSYTVSASVPTPIPQQPTPTPIVNCASNYSEGTISVNPGQGLFWFSSCGWTSTYVIVHYTGTGQAQQNLYMSYVSSAGRWQYTASYFNSTQTIIYWFTYVQNGTQYDSATYTWVHPGK